MQHTKLNHSKSAVRFKMQQTETFHTWYVVCEVVGQLLGVPHICDCKVASVSQHHNCKLVKI